jgi:CRP/FNR family transcriptional regulator, cyclic AMP receptor protein
MTNAGIDFAATASVLDHLSGYARERLARISRTEAFDTGATILTEGGATPFLGVVDSGRIALRLRVPEQGDPLTILTIEPGELFGWSAVVPPYRATVDAVATEPATVVAIDASELRTLLARDCDLAAEVLPLVLESLAARLAGSWHQLLDLFATRTPQPW